MPLINLSQLPMPEVIESLDYEAVFQQRKTFFLELYPAEQRAEIARTLELESEPIVKLLQESSYRELILRQRINEAATAGMLAYAQGSDLDHLCANFAVERHVIQPADLKAVPPVEVVMESDSDLRRRAQLAFDGLNTAGSLDSYLFHALSASGEVKDASVVSPSPCEIVVTILSRKGNGKPSTNVLAAVNDYFGMDNGSVEQMSKVRPLGDRVTVIGAEIVPYEVTAELTILDGPAADLVTQQTRLALDKYVRSAHQLGQGVTLFGIYAALNQPGIKNVILHSPATDITTKMTQAAWCTAVNLSVRKDYG